MTKAATPTLHLGFTDDAITLTPRGDRAGVATELKESGSALTLMTVAALLHHLRHEPPRADELEMAIAEIEDRLMPLLRQWPAMGALSSDASALTPIATLAGVAPVAGAGIAIEAVEALFNRLADVAWGTPASRLGIPTDRQFALRLLVLRELLHHGGFDAIHLVG